MATRLRIPGRGALAAYLALVAANYALDAADMLSGLVGGPRRAFRFAAFLAVAFDGPMLSAFALGFARWQPRPALRALLFAPSVLLAVEAALAFAGPAARVPAALHLALVPVLVGHYVLALGIAAHAHHRARTPRERDLRAAVVTVLALIVLPRLPLAFPDAGLLTGAGRTQVASLLLLEGTLLVVVAIAAALFVATAPPEARLSARRIVRHASALIGIVVVAWLLRFAPGFSQAAFALLYSARWIVFAGVLSIDAHRQRVLGLPASLSRPSTVAFLSLVAFLGLAEITTLLASFPGASLPGALAGGAAFTALLVAGGLAFGRRRAAEDESRLLARRVYRAHLELEAAPERLADLAGSLGLDPADAAEEQRLAALGRAAPAGGLDRPEPGRAFAGRYEVLRLAGSGSFGLVYEARDVVLGRPVVLKELRPDWRASPEAVARLRREAEVALRVAHPNLVPLLSLERAADGHVLVLERVEGETLADRLARGPLPPDAVGRLGRDLAAALGALHAAGLLHRDVKPENVVLRPDGHAVLLDLGSAGELRSTATRLGGGAHPGTPSYMSPEQRRGEPLTPASDLYTLALVLAEALGPAPPPAWGAFLARALAEDPAARPADAAAFLASLPA